MHSELQKILEHFQSSNQMRREEIWHIFGIANHKKTDEQIQYLVDNGYLRCKRSNLEYQDVLTITIPAIELLEAREQERQRRAAEDANNAKKNLQQIKDRKQDRRDKWLVAIVSSCFSAILTLSIEHFHEILVFVERLLSSLFH